MTTLSPFRVYDDQLKLIAMHPEPADLSARSQIINNLHNALLSQRSIKGRIKSLLRWHFSKCELTYRICRLLK